MKKFQPSSVSIPCHIRDIKNFIVKRPKHIRSVEQISKYESLPVPLLTKFFKQVQRAKTLKAFQLKWSYYPALQINAGHVKSIFRHHCKTIQKSDVLILYFFTPFNYKSLFTPLKACKTVSVYSNRDMKKSLALNKVENFAMKFTHEDPDYHLFKTILRRLKNMKALYLNVNSSVFNSLFTILNQSKIIEERGIKVEVTIEGDQGNLAFPKLHSKAREKIAKLNFQSIQSDAFLNKVLTEKLYIFHQLQTLMISFGNITTQTAYYLSHLSGVQRLQHLSLSFNESRLKNVAAEITRRLKLPPSLVTLELSMPLYLKSLITRNKVCLKNIHTQNIYSWRDRNIFEDEPAFQTLFQSFAAAKELKAMTLDFNLLEEFNPHYTNFVVSLLTRVQNLTSFEAYIKDTTTDEAKIEGKGCFDLYPFFKSFSKLEKVEQIEISMPNLIFEDAELSSESKCNLKSLTIGINENDESKSIKFANISLFVTKLLKRLSESSPSLVNLTLDFTEVVTERKLLNRFNLIKNFKKLEGLGLRFILKKCTHFTAMEVGRALQSLERLNTMVLKFTDSDKKIYGIQNYIRYHTSLRDMLVQLNESSWIDNDYFMDPTRCQIMQDFLTEDQDN